MKWVCAIGVFLVVFFGLLSHWRRRHKQKSEIRDWAQDQRDNEGAE